MAILSVAVALIISWLLDRYLVSAPVSLFLCAIMFSAWFGGIRPGLLAVALSFLAFVYYFVAPIHELHLPMEEVPRVVLFLLSALFVGSLSSAQRSATQSLGMARDDLSRTVQELMRANEALQAENAERRRVEDALRRSEDNLAEAQRLSLTGSFRWNVSSGDVAWSEETFRIYQHDPTTKPTAESTYQRIHSDDRALVKQTLKRALEDRKDYDLEHRLLTPDGSIKHVHVVARAFSDESGGTEFVGAVMDVTEQRQAKVALEKAFDEIKKSGDRLRMVIDTIPGMVWSGLPDGTFDFVNQPWLRYLGCGWDELSAQGGLVTVLHPDDVEGSVDRWNVTRATGRHTDHELRMRRADGQYRWFLTRALPLRDEQGNIIKWYGTATDIEDRKRAEVLLAGEKRLLEMIARGEPLGLVLDALCQLVEELASGALASILLLDRNTNALRHGSAPSLPAQYSAAIDGAVIGPSVGSCGTAAYRNEPVIVSDIVTDELWADYRELALAHGLRACWSMPIISSAGEVLGTFALYYREPRSPTAQELSVIGQISHVASIAIERAEAALALQQQANLLDQAHDAIFIWEFSRTIVYWNRGAEQLYGFSREEAVGRPSHEVLHTEHPMAKAEFEAALERDGEWSSELTHTTRDGRKIIVESRHVLINEIDGRRLVLETNRDITERKRAEEAVREQASLLNLTHDTIFVRGMDDAITYWNRGAEELYGWKKEEAIGQISHQLMRTVFSAPVEEINEELQNAGRWEGELIHTKRDGTQVTVASRWSLQRDDRGVPGAILETNNDITERKRAEEKQKRSAEALRQSQADLAHVSRVTMMGELTASLAHEVNQPITAAVTNANTCVRWLAGDTPNIMEARAAAIRSAKDGTRAAAIISRIRLLFEKGNLESELVDINEVIREIVILLRSEAARYSVLVQTELDTELPDLTGDRVQLQQVFMNLMLNGIDAMKDVDDKRELFIKTEQWQNEQILVSVRDTGIGLPPQVDQIFNAFFTTKLHGIGMGLSISRSIVEAHGGRLWAADNSPRGATFHIALPTRVEAH